MNVPIKSLVGYPKGILGIREFFTLALYSLILALCLPNYASASTSPAVSAVGSQGSVPEANSSYFSVSHPTILVRDGVALPAVVLTPNGQGPGPFPLIVMPASWAFPKVEYVGAGIEWAKRGYIVVSFTTRGFYLAGGKVDIAGEKTVRDVSDVITWALKNTRANPDAIGVSGISYGGGISLLAAGRDRRIKAVAAMSAWADLNEALNANGTPSAEAMAFLVVSGAFTSHFDSDLLEITRRVALFRYYDAVEYAKPMLPSRSAITELDKLNKNGAAVFIGNAFNDGLFPPNQIANYFEKLSVPKYLMLSQGDHTTAEIPGAAGLPNAVYVAAGKWFDRFLKGEQNGINKGPHVVLRSDDKVEHPYQSWGEISANPTVYYLTQPTGFLKPTGGLGNSKPNVDWGYEIVTGIGTPTPTNSGTVLISGLIQSIVTPPEIWLDLTLRRFAGVWMGPVLSQRKRVDGPAKLHLTIIPGASDVTLYAYLYSVENKLIGGPVGKLISHKPYTFRNVQTNLPQTIDISLEAASWNVPAGGRLAVVIGTKDLRYAGSSTIGPSLFIESLATDPSRLEVNLKK
jgi:putative CocE/NonD family hydrolase